MELSHADGACESVEVQASDGDRIHPALIRISDFYSCQNSRFPDPDPKGKVYKFDFDGRPSSNGTLEDREIDLNRWMI